MQIKLECDQEPRTETNSSPQELLVSHISIGSCCPAPLRKWKCSMCSSLLCFSGRCRIYLWFYFYLSFVWLQLIPQIFTVTLCSARCWYLNTMATIPIRSPLFWNTHVERRSSNPEKEHLRI